jgi:hypothetical protein
MCGTSFRRHDTCISLRQYVRYQCIVKSPRVVASKRSRAPPSSELLDAAARPSQSSIPARTARGRLRHATSDALNCTTILPSTSASAVGWTNDQDLTENRAGVTCTFPLRRAGHNEFARVSATPTCHQIFCNWHREGTPRPADICQDEVLRDLQHSKFVTIIQYVGAHLAEAIGVNPPGIGGNAVAPLFNNKLSLCSISLSPGVAFPKRFARKRRFVSI